jgi:hypothetical protein
VDEEEAHELARRELASTDLVITGSKRIGETWVVHYDNRKYVETGDVRNMEIGPGPILVSDDGRVTRASGRSISRPVSAMTLEQLLAGDERKQP